MDGINKDTTAPCFSPRYDIHEKASAMAVLATEHYINFIKDIIGPANFLQLFNLGVGSNLVIVIDTTGSMGPEITTVKEEVAKIVAGAHDSGIFPSMYILVPFNDPEVGPATKTTNSTLFLEAVDKLEA